MTSPISELQTLTLVCEAAAERKAHNMVVLDVRGQTIIADFFVVCTGTSSTHINAIAESVRDQLRELARLRSKPEGGADSSWIILDYSDVIVHVFNEETREFYDLERLWGDARFSRYPEEPLPGAVPATNADDESAPFVSVTADATVEQTAA